MSVPVFLYEQLAAARRRGEPFELAWPVAVSAAMRERAGGGREHWRAALAETRDAWEAAYDRVPAEPAAVAVANLAELTSPHQVY